LVANAKAVLRAALADDPSFARRAIELAESILVAARADSEGEPREEVG
jgi:hypothetical protein